MLGENQIPPQYQTLEENLNLMEDVSHLENVSEGLAVGLFPQCAGLPASIVDSRWIPENCRIFESCRIPWIGESLEISEMLRIPGSY